MKAIFTLKRLLAILALVLFLSSAAHAWRYHLNWIVGCATECHIDNNPAGHPDFEICMSTCMLQ